MLYLGLLALLSLGVGLAVRDTAAAVTTVLAALYILPLVAQAIPDTDLREDLLRIAPMTAGLSIQATRNLGTCRSARGPASACWPATWRRHCSGVWCCSKVRYV